jgi:hypothetical protein
MELLIGNLPPNAHLGELIVLFKGFSKMAHFRFRQKRREDGTILRYVVAEFGNDKYALKFREKFAGVKLHGNALIIREYFYRSYNNERRAVNWRDKPWRAGERRRYDRRHKKLLQQADELEAILVTSPAKEQSLDEQADSIKIEAYDNFVRKN